MKNFKTHTTFLLIMLFATISFGQNAEKILVKAFNLQGNKTVELDLTGNAEVEQWNENYLRVQMTIGIENGTEGMLKSLIKVGRYNLVGTEKDGTFGIAMPSIKKTVTVGGEQLRESYSYIVFAPADVNVEIKNAATTQTDESLNAFE